MKKIFVIIVLLCCSLFTGCAKAEPEIQNVEIENLFTYDFSLSIYDLVQTSEEDFYFRSWGDDGETYLFHWNKKIGDMEKINIGYCDQTLLRFDQKNQLIMAGITALKPGKYNSSKIENLEGFFVAYDLNLKEKWRCEMDPYIHDIIIMEDTYLVVKNTLDSEAEDDIIKQKSNSTITEVSMQGEKNSSFKRDNFGYEFSNIQTKKLYLAGSQVIKGKKEGIVFTENDDPFFSDFLVIPQKNCVPMESQISGVTLAISGITVPTMEKKLHEVNLESKQWTKEINLSQLLKKYQCDYFSLHYIGDQLVLIGDTNEEGKLYKNGVDFILIKLDQMWKPEFVYSISVDQIKDPWSCDITLNGDKIHMMGKCMHTDMIFEFDVALPVEEEKPV